MSTTRKIGSLVPIYVKINKIQELSKFILKSENEK